ncbi:MAG: hypothetical protein Q4F80_04020 [bacterium]|nr:hypothetical protein [bacterium]
MNMALDGETPYDNANLYGFFMRHMSVIKSTNMQKEYLVYSSEGHSFGNMGFYTTDGMRFEFRFGTSDFPKKLYESDTNVCLKGMSGSYNTEEENVCGGCGSLGLNNNPDQTTKPPCMIMVDVNGDRKPNPQNASCKDHSCSQQNIYKFSDPDGKKLTDLFTIMITDKEAIPYGVAAQRAMYNSQK